MVGSMLGDNVLPESVQSRRRQVRSRLDSLREPIRQRRQNTVPGPDVVGRAEDAFTGLRNRAVSRDSVLERISDMRGNGNGGGNGSGDNSGSDSGSSNPDENSRSGNREMV